MAPFHARNVFASRLYTRFPLNERSSSSSPPVLKLLSSPMVPAIITTTTSNASGDLLKDPSTTSEMSTVKTIKGVVVLARNGDRLECYQDPKTYKYGPTESTPFGEVRTHSASFFVAPL